MLWDCGLFLIGCSALAVCPPFDQNKTAMRATLHSAPRMGASRTPKCPLTGRQDIEHDIDVAHGISQQSSIARNVSNAITGGQQVQQAD